jgi:hypothetical protein
MSFKMVALLKAIFQPKDGTRQRVKEEVMSSRRKVEYAASQFELTIRELLDRNDRLTGRAPYHDDRH